jgi:hypothetical protein
MRPIWILGCVILMVTLLAVAVRRQPVPAYALPGDSPLRHEDAGKWAVYTVLSKKGVGSFDYVVEDQYGNRYSCHFHKDLPPTFLTSRYGSLLSVHYRILDAETGIVVWSNWK